MLHAVATALTAAVALVLGGAAASGPHVVNVLVHPTPAVSFPTSKQDEPSLAQNPTNPLNLISGANDEAAQPACTDAVPSDCAFAPDLSLSGFYASFDGGRTWPCQGLIDLSAFGKHAFGDPGQAFDSRGNAYYSTLAFSSSPGGSPGGAGEGAESEAPLDDPAAVFVARSVDGGCTYPSAAPVARVPAGATDDKPSIAVDANPKSRFRDRVYVAWTRIGERGGQQILFSRSGDGGATWSTPAALDPDCPGSCNGDRQGSTVQVGPDGSVYVLWLDSVGPRPMERIAISRDGGRTFPVRNVAIAVAGDDLTAPLPGSSFRQFRAFPSLAIGRKGVLYLGWARRAGGHAVAVLTTSRDAGRTWSRPVTAGDVRGRSAFFVAVAVDPNGRVGVGFLALDDRPTGAPPGPAAATYDAYFGRSTDGGVTFATPVVISAAASDPNGSSSNNLRVQFLGDYITTVADRRGGRFYVAFVDSSRAATCPAVDLFRRGEAGAPNVIAQCPLAFGDTDIALATVTY